MKTLTKLFMALALAVPMAFLMGADASGGCDPDPDDCVGPNCQVCDTTVDPNDQYYGRFEGLGFNNTCNTDADCVVGGCSGEVCAAESVFTTCEALPYGPSGSCGCLDGLCQWYSCQ